MNRGDSSEWTVLLTDLVAGVSVRSEWPFGCQVVCNACGHFGAVSQFIVWQKGIYGKTYSRYNYIYTQRQRRVQLVSVGLAQARPNYLQHNHTIILVSKAVFDMAPVWAVRCCF